MFLFALSMLSMRGPTGYHYGIQLLRLRNHLLSGTPLLLVMGDLNQVLTVSEAYSLYPSDLSIRGMTDFQVFSRE